MKKALVLGVTGQDGAYLSKLLLSKEYKVFGGSRDAQTSSFKNLKKIGVENYIEKISVNINDFRSILQTIQKTKPDEIYNLSGQSSVGLSFEQPVETMESIVVGTLNVLEAIRFNNPDIKFYNAGSSESFGDTGSVRANEETPFRPRSPYGVAKASAFWQVANYRESYNLHASTGILFNHESPLRHERFVTKKIIATACRIGKGSNEKLVLGNIEIARDWGWAQEYVEAMWLMLQEKNASDFVIATGNTVTLKDFIGLSFKYFNLDWSEFVEVDKKLFRPSDPAANYANPSKAAQILGWKAKFQIRDIVNSMVEDYLNENF